MFYAKQCNCGAVTVDRAGMGSHCMPIEDFARQFPDQWLSTDEKYHNCNHCVNHWGTDLCKCGSGEHPEDCCGGAAMQNINVKFEMPRLP